MAVCHTPRPEVEVLMGRAEELVGHKGGRIERVREGELSVFFLGGATKKAPNGRWFLEIRAFQFRWVFSCLCRDLPKKKGGR